MFEKSFHESLFWFFVQQQKQHDTYEDIVKHSICSMNKVLKHMDMVHFPKNHIFLFRFQQNLHIWFTSLNIKRLSFESQ